MPIDVETLRVRLQQAVQAEFEVRELLGSGGFAAVFRAYDPMLDRDVAIKVLDPRLGQSPEVTDRFLNEARTIAAVEHPNIITIYDVEAVDGVLYLVMRFLPGQSLAARLSRDGPLMPGEAARLARDVAEALHAAHQSGVVHRDIKPDNILFDANGRAVVTDFGIARAAEAARLTIEGTALGTPHYMSPEQAAGEAVDGRSDIYALGVVLYEMLSGRPPFEGKSAAQIMAKHLSQKAPPLKEVPVELDTVLTRAMAKEPDERYATAQDMAHALVTAATPVALESRVRRRLRRVGRWGASLGVLAVIGVLVVLGFFAGAMWLLRDSGRGAGPALNLTAPNIPPVLLDQLTARGALLPGDTVRFLFAPHDAGVEDALVFTASHLIRVTDGGTRRYLLTDTLDINFAKRIHLRRPNTGYVLVKYRRSPAVDTLYSDLSTREMSAVQDGLNDLLRSSPR